MSTTLIPPEPEKWTWKSTIILLIITIVVVVSIISQLHFI